MRLLVYISSSPLSRSGCTARSTWRSNEYNITAPRSTGRTAIGLTTSVRTARFGALAVAPSSSVGFKGQQRPARVHGDLEMQLVRTKFARKLTARDRFAFSVAR